MFLSRITMRNFRNYGLAQLDAHPRLNLIYGLNAQGKTNLLEAIYLLGVGKSFRTLHDEELIRHGEEVFYVKGEISGEEDLQLEVGYARDQKKQFRQNRLIVRKTADFFGNLPLVLFNPDDLQVIKAGPFMRRRLLDFHLSQISVKYKQEHARYQEILKQRNRLLREQCVRKIDESLLEVYTEQMTHTGAFLLWMRLHKIPRLQELAGGILQKISGRRECLELAYLSGDQARESMSLEETLVFLQKEGKKAEKEERKRGLTLFGPHRDELSAALRGQGELRTFGSQGQQRAAVLALKMALVELLQEETGKKPLLLLDDILSEFDDERQRFFLQESLQNVQTFLTYASEKRPQLTGKEWKTFRISAGEIFQEET